MRNYIKDLLNQYDLKPKKSLGQNFLINPKIYEDIINAADIKKGDKIIEIGAGIGTLTDYLAKAVGKEGEVIGIEKDSQFVKILKDRFKNNQNVIIKEGDILKYTPRVLNITERPATKKTYKIIGNIPYYLTSQLLRIIFEKWPVPKLIVLMVQKEVAKRIIAKPPKSNLLAVSVQYFSDPKIIQTVNKRSFWPQPGVDSAIIRLESRIQNLESREFSKKFFKIVKAGFSEKRKQLANSLSRGLGASKTRIEQILENSEVNPSRRAETLTIEEWKKITKTYF